MLANSYIAANKVQTCCAGDGSGAALLSEHDLLHVFIG